MEEYPVTWMGYLLVPLTMEMGQERKLETLRLTLSTAVSTAAFQNGQARVASPFLHKTTHRQASCFGPEKYRVFFPHSIME